MFNSILSKINSIFSSDDISKIQQNLEKERQEILRLKNLDKEADLKAEAKVKAEVEAQEKAKQKQEKAAAFLVAFEALADEAEQRSIDLKAKQEANAKYIAAIERKTKRVEAEANASVQDTLNKIKARQNKKNRFN